MCLNTGSPKSINYPFGTNGKLMGLGVPILEHFRVTNRKKNIGSTKTINFPFGTNGKLMCLGVPILKHFRVNHTKLLHNIYSVSTNNKELDQPVNILDFSQYGHAACKSLCCFHTQEAPF